MVADSSSNPLKRVLLRPLGVISMKIMALFDEHRKKIKFE